ncbi:MAG: branched-chain amino acid transport system II carrier protein [Clostridiales bacterium]|nr:branched-chain amino acid transport system II carrier protein [Clostridiales bacterium]
MKKLGIRDTLLVGITLFSMFFGAGNLIFPPYMANQAGTHAWLAFAGFALSAIGLPILGVIAVTREGGLPKLTGKVHPFFSEIYILILYLSIGPCLAIPRTASTSFEMAVLPFYQDHTAVIRFVYSAVFFCAAMLIARHPEKLTEYLGKRMTPCLLLLIITLFAASWFSDFGSVEAAQEAYKANGAVRGFLDGYQTMDTLAGLNFGMIIALNIRAKGVQEEKQVIRETAKAGWIAGGCLLAVYGMLTYIGFLTSGESQSFPNGAKVLTYVVSSVFGRFGLLLLAVIFVIACLNTCIGLLSCCGEYFHQKWPAVSRRNWILLFGAVSFLISNAGLDQILKLSVPVLDAIYPAAITLILLSCLGSREEKTRLVYPLTVGVCTVVSVLIVLTRHGILIPGITQVIQGVPFLESGFGWLVPTLLAWMFSMVITGGKKGNLRFGEKI